MFLNSYQKRKTNLDGLVFLDLWYSEIFCVKNEQNQNFLALFTRQMFSYEQFKLVLVGVSRGRNAGAEIAHRVVFRSGDILLFD